MPAQKSFFQSTIVSATGIFSFIAAVGGGVLYVDNNYAHANDVKEIIKMQQRQMQVYERNQKQNIIFQMEYYDLKIKQLEREKSQRNINSEKRDQIQEEIKDLHFKKEIVKRNLIDSN